MTTTNSTSSLNLPSLSSPGIGSGLNVSSIISKLMAVDSQPMQQLQQKQSSMQSEVSALGTLKSALATFQSALQGLTNDQLQAHTATSADQTKFTASADGSAVASTYQIEVSSLAAAKQSVSSAFADSGTTTIGSTGDQMTIQVGSSASNSFTVTIGGKTLQGIRDAINNASNNTGVTASILNTNAGYQLVLQSDQTGTANAFTTSFTDSSGTAISDPLSLSTSQSAADAVIKVNGQTATRSTNTISDVIQGVTLNLKGTDASGVTTGLTVANDSSTVKANIQTFVDAYNTLKKSLDKLESGALSGDNTVSLIRSQLLDVLNTPASGVSASYSYLAGIGVSIQKDGSMGIDTTQLDTALNTDPGGVAKLFLDNSQGFATRLAGVAQQMTAAGGLVDTETQAVNSNISALQNRIDSEQKSLDMEQKSLQQQYASLDALMGTMQSTSSFLTQQLANLPGG